MTSNALVVSTSNGSNGSNSRENSEKKEKDQKDLMERDARGRFVKGWKGGPGNPYPKKVHALRNAIYQHLEVGDVAGIMRAMVKAAQEGDVAAAKLVLNYILAQPNTLDQDNTESVSVIARIPRKEAIDILTTSQKPEPYKEPEKSWMPPKPNKKPENP